MPSPSISDSFSRQRHHCRTVTRRPCGRRLSLRRSWGSNPAPSPTLPPVDRSVCRHACAPCRACVGCRASAGHGRKPIATSPNQAGVAARGVAGGTTAEYMMATTAKGGPRGRNVQHRGCCRCEPPRPELAPARRAVHGGHCTRAEAVPRCRNFRRAERVPLAVARHLPRPRHV